MIFDVTVPGPVTPEAILRSLAAISSTIEHSLATGFDPSVAADGIEHYDLDDGFSCEWDYRPDPSELTTDCLACLDGSCVHCQAMRGNR